MPEHIEGSAQQLVKGGRLQDQAQPVIPVVVVGTLPALLDKQTQAFAEMIQAGHGRERIIDRRRHGKPFHSIGYREIVLYLKGVIGLRRDGGTDQNGDAPLCEATIYLVFKGKRYKLVRISR